jgi:hypothetical protein
MSTQLDPKTRPKQLYTLIGLSLPTLIFAGIWLMRSAPASVNPAMLKAGFAVIILIPLLAMGVISWRSRKDLDELQLRIQNDAALIVQNVSLGSITLIYFGEMFFKDAFPVPDFSSLSTAYIWLFIGAQLFARRRYQ